MAQQMEHLNGQTLQKLQQDRLVTGLDANFLPTYHCVTWMFDVKTISMCISK
jgi:hypothetical protein